MIHVMLNIKRFYTFIIDSYTGTYYTCTFDIHVITNYLEVICDDMDEEMYVSWLYIILNGMMSNFNLG